MPLQFHALVLRLGFCATVAALALAGCSSPQASPPTPQEMHLKQLAVFYGQYTGAHQGSGPRNQADFKAFITQRAGGATAEDIDSLFVSPRDQKPYVIAYNVRLGAMPAGPPPVVAHEEIGVEGKHFAADALGGVEELEQVELKKRALTGK
jgi:hypothetical protein